MKKDKIFIHFDTNDISIYQLNQKKIKLLKKKQVFLFTRNLLCKR